MASDSEASGARALALIDKLLAEKPHRVGHDFSATTRSLATYRDHLIGDFRANGSAHARERLDGVNAVLSVVIGGHFPLGPIPWEHIAKSRERLAKELRS